MIRFLILSLLLIQSLVSAAQVVQWASTVLEYSSQLTPAQYSANQILGKPNVLPGGGQHPNAWAPDKPNRDEFIKVGFATPMAIQQIAIAESHNPSALYRILVYEENGTEHEINTFNPTAVPLKSRMLNLFVERTPYKVAAVKLEFDGAAVPDYYGIDAIAIADSGYPVIAFIPQPALLADDIVIERLSTNVNSNYAELNPILSPDGKTLYFSRRNHPENTGGAKDREDIWYSELGADGKWQFAKNMGKKFNNAYPNFINSINTLDPEGKTAVMLLGNQYMKGGRMVAGLSVSTFKDGKWSDPTPLTMTNAYNLSERANYFLANNGKSIVMSVMRSDSYGDRDLYVSFLQPDSVWSEPLNLGPVVNTSAMESAPFLANDNHTLYFSSNGFSGYGGSDIYVTKRLDETWKNWSEPENLGPTINSPLEDLFFNIPNFSEYAYYSRGVDENNLDVYRVQLPIFKTPEIWVTVKGKLVDATTGLPLGSVIVADQLPDGKTVTTTQSDPATGEYELKLKAGSLYSIRAEAKDHLAESQSLDLRDTKMEQVMANKDFRLQPLKVVPVDTAVMITLNSVFFDFDQATLKPESYPELNRLVILMTERSGMNVEIAGHTCDIGDEQYNMGLSQRRANAVKNYLVTKGIEANRISVTYFGESRPAVPNSTVVNRRKNRRVEFKISKV